MVKKTKLKVFEFVLKMGGGKKEIVKLNSINRVYRLYKMIKIDILKRIK